MGTEVGRLFYVEIVCKPVYAVVIPSATFGGVADFTVVCLSVRLSVKLITQTVTNEFLIQFGKYADCGPGKNRLILGSDPKHVLDILA